MGKSSRGNGSLRSWISSLPFYCDRYLAPSPEAQKQTSEKILISLQREFSKRVPRISRNIFPVDFPKNYSPFAVPQSMFQLELSHDIKIIRGIRPVAGIAQGHR